MEIKQNPFMAILLVIILITSGCLDQSNQSKRKSKSKTDTAGASSNDDVEVVPTFDSKNNFFQSAAMTASSNFVISIDEVRAILLRGPGVDQFIKSNVGEVKCLVIEYQSPELKTLILSLSPDSFTNFTTKSKENFYRINATDLSKNTSLCDTSALDLSLSRLGVANIVFSSEKICTTCNGSTFLSSKLRIFDPRGQEEESLELTELDFNIATRPSSTQQSATVGCTTNTQCQIQGLDCCLSSQCVNHLTPKETFTSSDPEFNDFNRALAQIQANQTLDTNLRHFFYFCSNTPDSPPSSNPTETPEQVALREFLEKQSLYECANPIIDGEMGLCRMSFSDVNSRSSKIFSTRPDDRNFTSVISSFPNHSLFSVVFAGKELVKNSAVVNESYISIKEGNDNLTDSQQFEILYQKKDSDPNDTLTFTYKVDASCRKITSNPRFARCQKSYIQAQSKGLLTDHDTSKLFKLPEYANLTTPVTVKVDGLAQGQNIAWTLVSSPVGIQFTNNVSLADSQKVTIEYLVDLEAFPNLLSSVEIARADIGNRCGCIDQSCTLGPKVNDEGQITDYICDYSGTSGGGSSTTLTQISTTVSTRNAPHRYYDKNGLAHDNITYSEIAENANLKQELNEFNYKNGNNLYLPNNFDLDSNKTVYVGFNELLGSFSMLPNSSLPAKAISVPKGKSLDIFVTSGSVAECATCGRDEYSSLHLYPGIVDKPGAGVTPDGFANDHFKTSTFRADDLSFGRACFVPPTMLPWSHAANSDINLQRRSRLNTQHFYYANGLQRDWYGFDYGSVIGSFDGVTWFSIGSKRRISSTTNKLFLAVNLPYQNLMANQTFSVAILDSSTNAQVSDIAKTDFESDGAECQKMHQCQNDSDCISALGWDYACEDVSGIKSPWPIFDANAKELANRSELKKILALNGSFSGGSKRCVYRGRGALCQANYFDQNADNTYSHTNKPRHLGCNMAYQCATKDKSLFNQGISRIGKSIKSLNLELNKSIQESSLAAPHLGRPQFFNGTSPVPEGLNLAANSVEGLCIPGRNIAVENLAEQNGTIAGGNAGSRVTPIGQSETSLDNTSSSYLNSCSTLDENNLLVNYDRDLADVEFSSNKRLSLLSSSQNISTNALSLIETLTGKKFLSDFTTNVSKPTLEKNRCLRAPGSTCFSNLDCSVSSIASPLMALLDNTNPGLNSYEIGFWKSEMICSQAAKPRTPEFSVSKNRCCYATLKTVTVPTFDTDDTSVAYDKVPATEIGLNSAKRYSALSTSHFATTSEDDGGLGFPKLLTPPKDSCSKDAGGNLNCGTDTQVYDQPKTLSFVAKRSCCSGTWIREFHQTNGGGHDWRPSKMQQNYPLEEFKRLNWTPVNSGPKFSCAGLTPNHPDCRIREIDINEANDFNNYFSSFELLGIPQVSIKGSDYNELNAKVTDTQTDVSVFDEGDALRFLVGLIDYNSQGEYQEGNRMLYSAADKTNFDSDLKQVFSRDKFACCLPLGSPLTNASEENQCCSGYMSPETKKCALRNYSNVSIYFNRFVSSEGNELNENLFDPQTGTLKNIENALAIACEKKACASGVYGTGIAYGLYPIPGLAGQQNAETNRFIEATGGEDNNLDGKGDFFKEGLRWNTNLYCLPREINQEKDLHVFTCN